MRIKFKTLKGTHSKVLSQYHRVIQVSFKPINKRS